ncbi:hypothetical protein Rs2_42159 [Raphanus sativus]|nr:hypothetical protein Rs2_42159 [Raphanus sativus]
MTQDLTSLSSGFENNRTLGDEREINVDSLGVGNWWVKNRVESLTKRVICNWVSRIGQIDHRREEMEGGFRDLCRENSEKPTKDESIVRHVGGSYGSCGNREFGLSEPSNTDWELGITTKHGKLCATATSGSKTKTLGPGAKFVLKVLPRDGI